MIIEAYKELVDAASNLLDVVSSAEDLTLSDDDRSQIVKAEGLIANMMLGVHVTLFVGSTDA